MSQITARLNYKHTMVACYIGYLTQALVINFSPLLFVTLKSSNRLSSLTISAIKSYWFSHLASTVFCHNLRSNLCGASICARVISVSDDRCTGSTIETGLNLSHKKTGTLCSAADTKKLLCTSAEKQLIRTDPMSSIGSLLTLPSGFLLTSWSSFTERLAPVVEMSMM